MILESAIKTKFKATLADKKAQDFLEKSDGEKRKIDSHAKILIGIAATTLAKNDPALREKLLNDASQMQSANLDAIKNLLN